MTEQEQQEHARATEQVLSIVAQFLEDDTKKFLDLDGDLVEEAIMNAIDAARHARELLKRKALGLELAPLGYYLKDDELSDHVNIDRLPGGGIWIDPV
jgi:hypothetical protein